MIRIILIAFALLPTLSFGQTCKGIQYECDAARKDKENNKKTPYAWQYNNQSRYGTFAYGDTTEVNIVVYKGVNYRISFCSLDPQLEGKLMFQLVELETKAETEVKYETRTRPKEKNGIIEMRWDEELQDSVEVMETYTEPVKKRVYGKVPVIRYDNSKDNNKQYVEFTTDKTRKLTIKLVVPQVGEKSKNELAPTGYACVGMQVEHQKGPGTTGWK